MADEPTNQPPVQQQPPPAQQQLPAAQQPPPEQRFTPPLPKQIRDQIAHADQIRDQMALPEEEPEEEPEDEQEPELPFEEEEPQGEDTWERRARSTAGRLGQALTANQQMARRVTELEQSVANLRMRGGEPPAQPVKPAEKPKYVKEEEIADYGEEFFDVVGRRAREEFFPQFDELTQRLKRLESGQQAVGQVVAQTQKRGMYDALYEAVPDWREINHHPAFLNWLSFPDPYSGQQRREMLKDAFTGHEANRVINFFPGIFD